MNRFNTIIRSFILLLTVAFVSCDDTTGNLGGSLTDIYDTLDFEVVNFRASTESVAIDSILTRSANSYLGCVKDPETNSYVRCNYMTQFHCFDDYEFPEESDIVSRANGAVIADSCVVVISYNTFFGDSLATMRCTLHELAKPMKEGEAFYSSYSPIDNGYVRNEAGSLHISRTYSIADLRIDESKRKEAEFIPYLQIKLNQPYTDKDGNEYNNYGTYIMRKYYESKKNFHNSYTFINNVCPGFYIESTGGSGSMMNVYVTQMTVYFTYKSDGKNLNGVANFSGTSEVIQKTDVVQDKDAVKSIAEDSKDFTYLKTPAGIFTRVILPVDSIARDTLYKDRYVLRNDSLSTARMTIHRINNTDPSLRNLSIPKTLLAIPDTMKESFFMNNQVADYRKTFLVTYDSKSNSYTLGNIGGMITAMAVEKHSYITEYNKDKSESEKLTSEGYNKKFPNWNKFLLIPVTTEYTSAGNSNVLTSVKHDTSLTSTKLEGGVNNPGAIKLSVIYSKFQR